MKNALIITLIIYFSISALIAFEDICHSF
jgi:hypothetical protein